MVLSQKITDLSLATPPFFWGVDVGGTNIKIGLVDNQGETLFYRQIATNEAEGAQSAVDRIATLMQETERTLGISGAGKVVAAGLGTPGCMDLPSGMLLDPPNLPHWWNFPIRDALALATGLPVTFINDANAAAYGEYWLGTGRQHRSMILLTLGTGVGGGIIVEEELVNGVNSFGSECGHIVVDSAPNARLCVWGGGQGHLEAYASASAVAQIARERLATSEETQEDSSLSALPASEITAKSVYHAALAGDTFAQTIIDETATWLGIGVTTLVATIDPGLVVLGGAMDFGGADCTIGRRFLDGIRAEFKRRTFANVFEGTTIDFAALGGDAGYLGAAGYARRVFITHN